MKWRNGRQCIKWIILEFSIPCFYCDSSFSRLLFICSFLFHQQLTNHKMFTTEINTNPEGQISYSKINKRKKIKQQQIKEETKSMVENELLKLRDRKWRENESNWTKAGVMGCSGLLTKVETKIRCWEGLELEPKLCLFFWPK